MKRVIFLFLISVLTLVGQTAFSHQPATSKGHAYLNVTIAPSQEEELNKNLTSIYQALAQWYRDGGQNQMIGSVMVQLTAAESKGYFNANIIPLIPKSLYLTFGPDAVVEWKSILNVPSANLESAKNALVDAIIKASNNPPVVKRNGVPRIYPFPPKSKPG